MEAPEPTCPAPSAKDQPASALGHLGGPNGQASPQLTLGPVVLPPEQGLPPTVFLKALPIPLYHTVPPGGLQPRAPLVTGSLDGGGVPFILSPLLQPEGPGSTQVGKPAPPALTVNIVGTLPVLSPGLGSTLGSPGKVRNAGKYLCPHCGRDCLKPSVLEKHIRSHTGERPFPCSICGIAFKTQSNLYKHRRTQTHLNNSRLSLESEGGGSGLLEDGDRPAESSSADSRVDEAMPEGTLSPGAHPTFAAKTLEVKTEAASCAGSTLAHREVPGAATQMPSPGLPLASPQSRRKLPESKPCSQQRQQDMCSEKPWDAKASEGRLRKCESTDSGYLSRSDSAEQPPVASSPLHSLSEHSAESEGEGGPGPGSGGTKAELATPGTSLELEKKRLEERITQLISHNQAVVDDPQLDHVRPRKTVLSKQGSIDLPMPYTYKDSFHFDIRALEPGRRRAALSPACSTFTPVDKSRPLFFHSVPTQLSSTVECVPITRSNSLPFIEGSKMWPEPRDLQDTCPRMRKPLSPRLTPARLGCRSGLTLADIPTGHPRALVRQAAIEDVLCTPTGDTSAPAEDLDGRTAMAAVGTAKGRGSKKSTQRKMRVFSQEKWQVYGNETFKKIYQKMKTSRQGGQKARAELDLPPQEEAVGVKGASLSEDSRTSILGDISEEAKPGFWQSRPVPEGVLEANSSQKMKAVAKPEDSDQSRVAKTESLSLTVSHRDPPCLGSRSTLLPPSGRLDLGYQLPPAPESIQREDLGIPRLASPDLLVEGDLPGDGSSKDSRVQTMLRRPSGVSGEPMLSGDKLPSERKKLKVDGLDPQEQPGPLGTEALGSSSQAAALSSQKQDSDLREMPGGSHEHARTGAAPQESSGISSTASATAPEESGNKETLWVPSASVPRHHSQLATQAQTPSVLAALADRTFAPKYLLRLPQGETSSPPATPGPGQGRDSLCTGVRTGPRSGMPISSSDSTPKDPSWSRSGEGRDDTQSENRADTSVPVAGSSSKSAKGGTWEIASMLPTCTCDAHMAQNMDSETHSICHLGTDSPIGARTCGGLLNPWSPTGKLGVPPENAPKGMPSESTTGVPSSCSFQACYFLKTLSRSQGVPEPSLSPHLGSPSSCRGPSSFPSLKAEPQLTWCCLSRSLPLPTEQEKVTSGHWSLPSPGSLWDECRDPPPKSRGERTSVSRCGGGGGPQQTPELSYVTVPGTRPQDPGLDPQPKKGLCRRRVKASRGNSKQKKRRLLPRRCEGSFCQSHAQLRASRLHRPPRVLRRSYLPAPLQGVEPRGSLRRASSSAAGLNVQGQSSCTSTELSLGHGNGEREENDTKQISEPGTSSSTVSKIDKPTLKVLSPCASEQGDGSHEKDAADGAGSSLQLNPCLAVAKEAPLPQGKGPDAGLLGIPLLSSQDQVCTDPKLCILSDVQEPFPFESEGTFPCHDMATSAVAMCIPLGRVTGPGTPGICSPEPQEHRWAVGETLTQSSPDRKDIAESPSQACLPRKPSPRQKISGLAPLGSPGKTHIERPDAGPSLSSSHQEGRSQADFSSRDQYGCGEVALPCSILGSDDGKSQALGLITAKGCEAPSAPGKPLEVPEANLRSFRKRSLEGMRKQARVELSDTSSDDEDRLVIEM